MKCEALTPGAVVVSHELVKCEVGSILGTVPGGKLTADGSATSYELRPPIVGVKRKLGELRSRKDLKDKPGRYVAEWLAIACSAIGDVNLEGAAAGAGALAVCRLHVGDVLFLMLASRLHASEDKLGLPDLECPHCDAEITGASVPVTDLEVMRFPRPADEEVIVNGATHFVSVGNPPLARVGLKHGVDLGNGKRAYTLLFRSPLWGDTMWGLSGAQWANPTEIGVRTILGTCCGCELEGVALTDAGRLTLEQLDGMHERDLELCEEAINRISPTPILAALLDCPACGKEIPTAIDWRVPGFFG